MNMFEMQERLKDFSKDQLVQEMQMPSGTAPPFLVLTELQRRTRMEQAMKADGQGAPQSTVAEDAVASAGVPQGGLQQMAQALAPRTDMTQNDGTAPVAAMQEGGMVESNAAQMQSVIDQVMGGGAASPMVPQMMSYAQRAAQLPQMAPPMQSTPTMPVAPAPAVPDVSGMGMSDLANLIQTAPDLATRQAALTAMRAGSEYKASDSSKRRRSDENYSMSKAKGGVIRYQEGGSIDMPQAVATDPAVIAMANRMGMSVQQYLENLDPEARRQAVRNVERRANMDLSEDDAVYGQFADQYGVETTLPSQSDLDARFAGEQRNERLGLSGIPSRLQAPGEDRAPDAPAALQSFTAGPVAPGARVQPPEMRSPLSGFVDERAPTSTGVVGGPHPIVERLARSPFLSGLQDPGSNDDIRSILQRIGGGAPVSGGSGGRRDTRTPSMVDTTDDARAARRFATDRAPTSTGVVGGPHPIVERLARENATDPGGPMEDLARESAEDKAAAVEAARAGVAAPAGQAAPPGAGGGAGGVPGATGVPANAEMSENERMFNQDKWLALARVGLGLMASQAPTFGQALGEAGMAGVDALASAREDYLERKQAEELMALRRAAMSARGAGGGGGAMPGLEFDLSAGEGRALERLDNEIMAVENQILNMGEEPSTGFLGLGGPDAQWVMEREQLENRRRVLEAARDAQLSRLVTAGLGGSAPVATEASAPYSITDVR